MNTTLPIVKLRAPYADASDLGRFPSLSETSAPNLKSLTSEQLRDRVRATMYQLQDSLDTRPCWLSAEQLLEARAEVEEVDKERAGNKYLLPDLSVIQRFQLGYTLALNDRDIEGARQALMDLVATALLLLSSHSATDMFLDNLHLTPARDVVKTPIAEIEVHNKDTEFLAALRNQCEKIQKLRRSAETLASVNKDLMHQTYRTADAARDAIIRDLMVHFGFQRPQRQEQKPVQNQRQSTERPQARQGARIPQSSVPKAQQASKPWQKRVETPAVVVAPQSAEDYLGKPIDHAAVVEKVKSAKPAPVKSLADLQISTLHLADKPAASYATAADGSVPAGEEYKQAISVMEQSVTEATAPEVIPATEAAPAVEAQVPVTEPALDPLRFSMPASEPVTADTAEQDRKEKAALDAADIEAVNEAAFRALQEEETRLAEEAKAKAAQVEMSTVKPEPVVAEVAPVVEQSAALDPDPMQKEINEMRDRLSARGITGDKAKEFLKNYINTVLLA